MYLNPDYGCRDHVHVRLTNDNAMWLYYYKYQTVTVTPVRSANKTPFRYGNECLLFIRKRRRLDCSNSFLYICSIMQSDVSDLLKHNKTRFRYERTVMGFLINEVNLTAVHNPSAYFEQVDG